MSEEVTLRRGFTGLWIPADIVEDERLTMLEKWLYGEIEAFNRGNDKRGCFASNSFFAKQLGVKENTVSKAISHLKELGLIEQVAFDGRQRILKIIGSIGFKSQSALDKNHSLSNKEERKEENKERSVSLGRSVWITRIYCYYESRAWNTAMGRL